jgi:hypothetical protein
MVIPTELFECRYFQFMWWQNQMAADVSDVVSVCRRGIVVSPAEESRGRAVVGVADFVVFENCFLAPKFSRANKKAKRGSRRERAATMTGCSVWTVRIQSLACTSTLSTDTPLV